jgi:type II secretory pathway predicted ATPase ExeA
MSIEQIRSHFGFTKMPFGKDLAPSMLHRHQGREEALARISFLVQEHAIGVLTGEVGLGKTVCARAAFSELEPSRYSVIYLAIPAIGARASTPRSSRASRGATLLQVRTHCPGERSLGQGGDRARTTGRGGR